MTSIDQVERLLAETPAPCLTEGPHREQLKQRLLMEPSSTLQMTDGKRRMALIGQMSLAVKVAATLLAAVLLVGVGWAAEKIYEALKFNKANVTLETYPPQEWTLPGGNTVASVSETITVVDPNDPEAVETALRQQEEVKELIGKKKYRFLRAFESEYTNRKEYVYQFTLADGSELNMNFSIPLENVASWDEYLEKEQQQMRLYQEQVNRAFAAGRYRLIDQDFTLVHICLDRGSGKKYRVDRIPLRNGEELAVYRPYDATDVERGATEPQSSWQEHLQAIRDGRLELLKAETIANYKYELIFEDGSKRIFFYGGEPIKPPKPE